MSVGRLGGWMGVHTPPLHLHHSHPSTPYYPPSPRTSHPAARPQGKRGGKADSVAQPEINRTLVEHALPGRLVVSRLVCCECAVTVADVP